MALLNIVILYLLGCVVSSWDYSHPDNWHQAYPDCAASDESPINIDSSTAINDEDQCEGLFDWEIEYEHQTFKVINNAHTLQVVALGLNEEENENYTKSKNLDEYTRLSSNYDTIASFPNYFRPKGESGHRLYCLDSFHFHWGENSTYGSEHTVNGQRYPLEAHFVHYACDFNNLLEAQENYESSPDPDEYIMAVVSLLFEVSEEDNPAFSSMLKDSVLDSISMPDDLETRNITGYDIVYDLDLMDLIPEDIYDAGYWGYEGSLTTPPCTNKVRWYLSKALGSISEQQLWRFRVLLNGDLQRITRNYRQIQSNVNEVYNCGQTMNAENSEKKLSSTAIVLISVACSVALLVSFILCLKQCNKRRREKAEKKISQHVVKDYGISTELDEVNEENAEDNYFLMYGKNQK